MKQLIEFPLDNNDSVLIEVDVAPPEGGYERIARHGEIVATANETLETALERVKPAFEAVLDTLKSLSKTPESIEVAFGLKVSGDVGIIIASTSVEANFTVKLTWKRDKPS